MTIFMILAVVFVLASVVLSQKIAVNAAAKLDDETKLRMADVFPRRNVNYTVFVFSGVIIFILSLYLLPEYSRGISVAAAMVFIVYIFAKLFLNVRKLKEIGAPSEFIRSVIISFAVFIGGVVAAGIMLSVRA